MGESIALHTDIDQCSILVQGFKHDSFDLLAKEVVGESDLTDFLVSLEGIDQRNKAYII